MTIQAGDRRPLAFLTRRARKERVESCGKSWLSLDLEDIASPSLEV
jgi:hypothetical protein